MFLLWITLCDLRPKIFRNRCNVVPGYLHNVDKKILQLPVVSSESSFKKQCLYFLLLINYQVSKAELFVKKINIKIGPYSQFLQSQVQAHMDRWTVHLLWKDEIEPEISYSNNQVNSRWHKKVFPDMNYFIKKNLWLCRKCNACKININLWYH